MDLQQLGTEPTNPKAAVTCRTQEVDECVQSAKDRYLKSEKGRATSARYAANWRRRNRQRNASNTAAWRERNREHLRAQYKKYYAKNRKKRVADAQAFRLRHHAKLKVVRDTHRAANKDAINKRWRDYYAAHPDKLAERYKKYLPRRLAINRIKRLSPKQRLIDACRTRTRFLLRKAGVPKFNHTFDLIGCTPDFLKTHLESQFEPWMNWDNFGVAWEIDHIAAISRFDISDEAQKLTAFNYKNCRPFRKSDNRSKCNLTHEEWTAKSACASPPACRRAGP